MRMHYLRWRDYKQQNSEKRKLDRMILILMGVSGCGKTTVGTLLGEKISFPFYDADDFHPPSNKAKMSSGVPLNDEDRLPWLETLRNNIERWSLNNRDAILACSALKKAYREHLVSGILNADPRISFQDKIVFVYLKGTMNCISDRISQRKGHFMPLDLLRSQFKDLEEPTHLEPINYITVDVNFSVVENVCYIMRKLGLH